MEKENPNYYAIIPANVRYDKELKANCKLLYGEITALSNKEGYCWASNSYLSELYSVTPQAVSRWIKQLEEKGYISLKYIRKGEEIIQRNIYVLVSTKNGNGVSTNGNGVSTNSNGVSTNSNGGYQQKVKENITSINNTINNTINNNKVSKKGQDSFDEVIEKYTSNPELKETIVEYIKMRVKKKANPTNKALELVFKKLDKFSTSAQEKIKILEQSILNNWTDIYEIKEEKGENKNASKINSGNNKGTGEKGNTDKNGKWDEFGF